MSATQRTIWAEPALRGRALRARSRAAEWAGRARSVARATTTRLRARCAEAAQRRNTARSLAGDEDLEPTLAVYLSVGLVAGAVVALQIAVMRIFAVGSWAHFGSLAVSLAMLGFGLTGATMCIAKDWFERNWQTAALLSLMLLGPLMVGANLIAQQIPFNAVLLASHPVQMWRLGANFILYMLPFLAGALFLGTIFLRARKVFARVYFADLTGSGLCGLLILGAMYVLAPHELLIVPLLLWLAGGALWFVAEGRLRSIAWLGAVAAACITLHLAAPTLNLPTLAVSDHKGAAQARQLPDSELVYSRASPFGLLEVYSSAYLPFAPGLSDNRAFDPQRLPHEPYLGLYIDGDGPTAVMRARAPEQTASLHPLPMVLPYLIKPAADVFVVEFGGGISTSVALRNGAKAVTVAESNPAVLHAFRKDPTLLDVTGHILYDRRIKAIGYDGRLHLASTKERFDVIDLSLADSAGLPSPGGFAVTEKFAYSREAMTSYMRALREGGILSVTLWNKEEPPKSVLRLYATMAAAARRGGGSDIADRFFVAASHLSTATVLYKRGGFTPEEIAKLRAQSAELTLDEIYSPGMALDAGQAAAALEGYRVQILAGATPARSTRQPTLALGDAAAPATIVGRLAWHHLVHGGWDEIAQRYPFDVRPLTNNRPYFAAYVKLADLPGAVRRLELFQDDWGYLLVWATLFTACAAAILLVLLPLAFGWRTILARSPGKVRSIGCFACLGAGYIMVEVGLISKFTQALSNATVSASVLITGMLVFSGLGSLASERYLERARWVMPRLFLAIGAILIGYGLALDRVLDWIGAFPYGLRLLFCFVLILPPAFLMGLPMPIAMTSLSRLGKDHMFLWAWGVNGCFSVVGAAMVPVIAASFGLAAVLMVAGLAYLLAMPGLFAILSPLERRGSAGSRLS